MIEIHEKFTPGPWELWRYTDDRCPSVFNTVFMLGAENRKMILFAQAHPNFPEWQKMPLDELNANANMLAAAPEMYEGNADAMETMRMIESTGAGICADCKWDRKCSFCAMSEVLRLAVQCRGRLEKIQKKARGEE